MRIVCWFSCGVASAVATKLAISQYGKENIVIARCIVREEHPDNERFSNECEKWFDMQITNLINEKYDGSIYEVFNKKSYISGIGGAPCTLHLKKDVRIKFQLPTDKHVFGYCAEEKERFDTFIDENSMTLPKGKTCFDCQSDSLCQMLFGNNSENNQCDFYPIRFVQKEFKHD